MARMSIEPIDPPDSAEVRELLVQAGVPAEAVEHLLPALVEPSFVSLGLADKVEDGQQVRDYLAAVAKGIGGTFSAYKTWEPAFVHVVLCFLGTIPAPWWLRHENGRTTSLSTVAKILDEEFAPVWLGRLLDVNLPWATSLVTVFRMTGGNLDAEGLLRHLKARPTGYPAWDAALDWDAEERGLRCWAAADKLDPSRPWFWLRNAPLETESGTHHLFQDHAITVVERYWDKENPRTAMLMAMLLRDAAQETAWRQTSEGLRNLKKTRPLQPLREKLMWELPGVGIHASAHGAAPAALRAWLEAGSWIAARLPGEARLDPEQGGYDREVEAQVAAAGRVLGLTRQRLRDGSTVDHATAIAAIRVLRWLQGPAMALRHVQQLMASAQEPCTGEDLRYYDDEGQSSPPDLSWIPRAAAWVVNSMAVEEQDDPSLEACRTDVAAFLLRRLKSRDTCNSETLEPMEPRPDWRFGIIRAVEDLQVNPEGKGHHVLHRVAQDDPDEDVRRVAKKVYEKMRHVRGGEKQLTPRVKFLRSFWWLRYAQRAALGLDVDEPRARSVRSREVSRTQAAYWL